MWLFVEEDVAKLPRIDVVAALGAAVEVVMLAGEIGCRDRQRVQLAVGEIISG
jgi:hypothetical protein